MYKYKTNTKTLLGDLQTPVGLYLKLRDLHVESVLLESSDYHASENSLSFIAIRPLAKFSVNRDKAEMRFPDGKKIERRLNGDCTVSESLDLFISRFSVEGNFKEVCGLYGYTAFDAVRYFEPVPVKEYHHEENDADDICYMLFKYVLVMNHFKNELTIVELASENEKSGINEIESLINNRNHPAYNFKTTGEITSPMTDAEYKEMVKKGIAHCLRGDVFQIVLSRRYSQPFQGDDFKVYRALRSINPSPYLFYFDFGGFRIFGSSPETHCKINGETISIDPIAGTAFRTGDADEDKRRTEALKNDPKENAEHVMLVDLARNDLSRNAHNVGLDFYKQVQYYSHVIHLVSRVKGTLDKGGSHTQAFIDTFPAGTLSGAPKVRAMQLISELEPHDRGAYGGCIGIIGLDGNLNQAITIRSFVSRGNVLHFQAGAGIVAKSNPGRELQEVKNKLGALAKAIKEAEKLLN